MPSHLERARGWLWPAGFAVHANRYLRSVRHLERFLSMLPGDRRRSAVQAGGHAGVWPGRLADVFAAVYTFEPDAANFAALVENTGHRDNVYAARGVLGDERGPCAIRVHAGNSGGHHIRPGRGDVPTWRVDDMGLPDCDALVLDCEGGELRAVAGARDTIRATRPWILVELRGHVQKKVGDGSDDDVREAVASLGYTFNTRLGHDEVWIPCS